MVSGWPIRNKLIVGVLLLVVMVATLAFAAMNAVYSYRDVLRTLSDRMAELPLAAQLAQRVSDLRVALRDLTAVDQTAHMIGSRFAREEFALALEKVEQALEAYRQELETPKDHSTRISDGHKEWETVRLIEADLQAIKQANFREPWIDIHSEYDQFKLRLDELQHLTSELPSHLYYNIVQLRKEAKDQYRVLIILTWAATIASGLIFILFLTLSYQWVFRPLRVLIHGSREVAGGNFDYRIHLDSKDEMAELAAAMNAMTSEFQTIHDELDRQVQERTRQALNSEKLASVGFLAAGVAHEINNPLAAIAVGAEALEDRVSEEVADSPEREVIQRYLKLIQQEAFRCKGITEKLLDFSRMGDRQHHPTDLRELIQETIDLLAHHGKYKDKHLELLPGEHLLVNLNAQEMKQVVLNLLMNALESLDSGGKVTVELQKQRDSAVFIVRDNGCGMTQEVLEHLFEPFFTRRRGGGGTGLGLSITYRIIADHQGHIQAYSDGPGRGSEFRVTLPFHHSHAEENHGRQNHETKAAVC